MQEREARRRHDQNQFMGAPGHASGHPPRHNHGHMPTAAAQGHPAAQRAYSGQGQPPLSPTDDYQRLSEVVFLLYLNLEASLIYMLVYFL